MVGDPEGWFTVTHLGRFVVLLEYQSHTGGVALLVFCPTILTMCHFHGGAGFAGKSDLSTTSSSCSMTHTITPGESEGVNVDGWEREKSVESLVANKFKLVGPGCLQVRIHWLASHLLLGDLCPVHK
jgi:hypothetical protein